MIEDHGNGGFRFTGDGTNMMRHLIYSDPETLVIARAWRAHPDEDREERSLLARLLDEYEGESPLNAEPTDQPCLGGSTPESIRRCPRHRAASEIIKKLADAEERHD